jgi:hypothetical protein
MLDDARNGLAPAVHALGVQLFRRAGVIIIDILVPRFEIGIRLAGKFAPGRRERDRRAGFMDPVIGIFYNCLVSAEWLDSL